MRWAKYIVLGNGVSSERMIIFPQEVSHKEMAALFENDDFWTVVRGGKVSLEDRIACFGEAFSLRLRSDPEKDTALFQQMMGGEAR
jgi:hypothetical protein